MAVVTTGLTLVGLFGEGPIAEKAAGTLSMVLAVGCGSWIAFATIAGHRERMEKIRRIGRREEDGE